MKKILVFAGLLLSALTLTNCQKAENFAPESANGQKITFNAASQDVKTVNNGLETYFVAGDNYTVFHAEAGTEAYVKDNKDFAALSTGKNVDVSGTLKEALDPSKNYDWYIYYNFKGKVTTPKVADPAIGNGATNAVGSGWQAQAGKDSTSHLSGTTLPLVGHAWNVPAAEKVKVTMSHVASVVQVIVKNSTSEPVRIHSLVFYGNGKAGITGQQFIDYSTDEVKVYSSGAYTFGRLSIAKGQAIAPGEEESLYLAIAPFTAAAGDTLTVRVNGYEKSVKLAEEAKFESGHIKQIAFDYNPAAKDWSGDYYFMAYGTDGKPYISQAVETAAGDADGSGGLNTVLYAKQVKISGDNLIYPGDMGLVTGTETIDDYVFTIARNTTISGFEGTYVIKNKAGKYLVSSDVASGNSVSFVDELTECGLFDINANPDGSCYIVATQSPYKRFFGLNTSNMTWPRFTCLPETSSYVHTTPWPVSASMKDSVPEIMLESISVGASGAAGATREVEIKNNLDAWTLAVDSFTGCVTTASVSGTTLTYSVEANAEAEVKTGTIVLKLTDPAGAGDPVVKTVAVSQNAFGYYTKVSADRVDWTGTYILVCEDGEIAHVLYTDDNFNDGSNVAPLKGAPSFEVALSANGILASDVAAGVFTIEHQSDDGTAATGQAGTVVPGKYTFFLQQTEARPAKTGFGVWGRNQDNIFCFNNNSAHTRFQTNIVYDTVSGSIHCDALSKNGAATAYLRYDMTTDTFGWAKAATAANPFQTGTLALANITIDAADVQFYEIVE